MALPKDIPQPSEYQRWDYIILSDFKARSFKTGLSYAWLWCLAIIAVAVYGADTFTAINLLVFDRWSSQIDPTIPISTSKWIFAACILFSWVLCIFEWIRAVRVIRRGNVAESYLDPLAATLQSIRTDHDFSGWHRFLVFAELTRSKRGADYVALFTYFQFKGAVRILLAEGPRQAVNALTLYSVMQANLIPVGQHAASDGHTAFVQFFVNLQILAEQHTVQALILLSMLFTLTIWAISLLSFLIACVLYVTFLSHYIPNSDGTLSRYCRRKIDTRLGRIADNMFKKTLKQQDAQRRKYQETLKTKGKDGNAQVTVTEKRPTFPPVPEKDPAVLGLHRPAPSRAPTLPHSVGSSPPRAPSPSYNPSASHAPSPSRATTLSQAPTPLHSSTPSQVSHLRRAPTEPHSIPASADAEYAPRRPGLSSRDSFDSYRSDDVLMSNAATMGTSAAARSCQEFSRKPLPAPYSNRRDPSYHSDNILMNDITRMCSSGSDYNRTLSDQRPPPALYSSRGSLARNDSYGSGAVLGSHAVDPNTPVGAYQYQNNNKQQYPMSDHQSPFGNYQPPLDEYQRPIRDHGQAVGDYKLSLDDYVHPSSDRQRPGFLERQPTLPQTGTDQLSRIDSYRSDVLPSNDTGTTDVSFIDSHHYTAPEDRWLPTTSTSFTDHYQATADPRPWPPRFISRPDASHNDSYSSDDVPMSHLAISGPPLSAPPCQGLPETPQPLLSMNSHAPSHNDGFLEELDVLERGGAVPSLRSEPVGLPLHPHPRRNMTMPVGDAGYFPPPRRVGTEPIPLRNRHPDWM